MTSDAKPRLVLVPRWGGDASSDFYPWLLSKAEPLGFGAVDVVALAPTKEAPVWDATTAAVREALSRDGDVVIVAHSVGCQAAMHALARPRRARVRAVLLVAAWTRIDRPWDTIQPWLDHPPDFPRARAGADDWFALISDDDPFTADHHATKADLERELGAIVTVVPGGRHFNGTEEPWVGTLLVPIVASITA